MFVRVDAIYLLNLSGVFNGTLLPPNVHTGGKDCSLSRVCADIAFTMD